MKQKVNRLMITSPSSGGGKTTITCAILQAMCLRGMHPSSFKCGPDYIDPMFHEEVIGAKSSNLDLFLSDAETVKRLLIENSEGSDISVIEGAMGFYDGIGITDSTSAYKIAVVTETPAVLVVDARAQSLSAAALCLGFKNFRSDMTIRGVIFNKVGPEMYELLKEAVEKETGLKVFGYLPNLKDCVIESRHLGLVTANEISDLKDKLNRLAEAAEKTVDIDGLIELAADTPIIEAKTYSPNILKNKRPRIAVAYDNAFCFYYKDTFKLFEKIGAELVFFSPLNDNVLPGNISGLYLGGGYPELYADRLSANKSMINAIKHAINNAMPIIAECGGFMYLHTEMESKDGVFYPMAGVFPYKTFRTNKLVRFGYTNLVAKSESLMFSPNEGIDSIPAHEFHYWDSENPGDALYAAKPMSEKNWNCAHVSKTMYAGYPHLYLCGNPRAAERFIGACTEYIEMEKQI